MRVKLYTDYVDGRKVCYIMKMKKSATESNIEFDYYVKINRDRNIKKMTAVVINDDGKVICKDLVKKCWRDEKSTRQCYFGITICGNRIVSDTVPNLQNKSEGKNVGFVVEYIKDENGNQLYDKEGNPVSNTRRVIINGRVKNVDSSKMSFKMQKLIHGYNKWHL